MDQKFTLLQLNQQIRDILEKGIPGAVWVIAEISELNENRSGHCYLELIEREGNNTVARARAVIWSYTYRILKPYFETTTGRPFSQGIKILVQSAVEYHPLYGMSLIIKDIEPAYTIGDVALQRKEIIEKLKAENIFDMNKELELPLVPQNIAVISSKTAAGYQDFIDQLKKNSRGFKFYTHLFESYMQGTEAVPSIIGALEKIFKNESFFDAVAIIRGGGSAEDLSCFDNYDLALHVTQFPLPVITGIGHEKDDTIVDMVAHTRLKTPTAVAEFFISGAERFHELLKEFKERLTGTVEEAGELFQLQLNGFAQQLADITGDFVDSKVKYLTQKGNILQFIVNRFSYKQDKKLDSLRHSFMSFALLKIHMAEKFLAKKGGSLYGLVNEAQNKKLHYLDYLAGKVKYNLNRYLTKQKEKISFNENAIRLLHPENILKRGYSITYSKGKPVKSVRQLEAKDELETLLSDGRIKSLIIKKENNGTTKNLL